MSVQPTNTNAAVQRVDQEFSKWACNLPLPPTLIKLIFGYFEPEDYNALLPVESYLLQNLKIYKLSKDLTVEILYEKIAVDLKVLARFMNYGIEKPAIDQAVSHFAHTTVYWPLNKPFNLSNEAFAVVSGKKGKKKSKDNQLQPQDNSMEPREQGDPLMLTIKRQLLGFGILVPKQIGETQDVDADKIPVVEIDCWSKRSN